MLPERSRRNRRLGVPAYWNGTIYYWGRIDHLKAFPLVNGLLSTTPTESTEEMPTLALSPSISANGSTRGHSLDHRL